VIYTNLHPLLYRFEVMADCCLNSGGKRYKNVGRSFFLFVTMHAFDGQTDEQTDRFR